MLLIIEQTAYWLHGMLFLEQHITVFGGEELQVMIILQTLADQIVTEDGTDLEHRF